MKQINEQIDSKSGLENGVVETGFNFHLKQLKKKDKINTTIVMNTLTENNP